jgi:hypothetical protein
MKKIGFRASIKISRPSKVISNFKRPIDSHSIDLRRETGSNVQFIIKEGLKALSERYRYRIDDEDGKQVCRDYFLPRVGSKASKSQKLSELQKIKDKLLSTKGIVIKNQYEFIIREFSDMKKMISTQVKIIKLIENFIENE